MSDENKVSILICKDAGTASRTLLARADLRIRWALTANEASAVVGLTRCMVVITRAALAKSVLAKCATSERGITSVVLLEPAQWSEWRDYFEAGATYVLRASAVDELLDTLTDATGVAFRSAPRVPFKSTIRFAEGGGEFQTLNLSTSGICIVGFPPYALGSEVDLVVTLDGKDFEFNAIISQIFRVGEHRAVGLAFHELTPELQMHIEEYTRRAQERGRFVTEPVEEFDPLDEGTLLALRSSAVQGDSLSLVRALTSDGTIAAAEHAEPWLVAACRAFTSIEVAAVQAPRTVPQWAHDAVIARISAYRARARAGTQPPSESDVREIFGLCQRLAESAIGSDDESLVQVTNIRGEVLRALYDPELLAAADIDF
jgi:hypothetical protein